jgi:predicted ATPase
VIGGSQVLRLDPDELRTQSGLIADGQPLRLTNERGAGLPGVYDAIVTRDVDAYVAISADLARLFPAVKSLSLRNASKTQKALGVQLKDGTLVSSEYMSEGLLYYLAFAALPHLERTAMFLVEEPENGLHPARIAEVMRVLREISKTTQVIIATHSPLVINEMKPEEVSVLTRNEKDGTTVRLIKDTPSFAERSAVYALGELWVSYANGQDEGPLVNGGPRP